MSLAVGVTLLSTKRGRACPPWKHHSLAGILQRELGCSTHSSFSASGLWGHVTSSLRPLLLHLLTRNCELRKPILFPTFLCSSIPAVGRETGIHLPHPPGVHLRPSVSCFLPPLDSSPAHPGTAHRPILPAGPPVCLVFILHPVTLRQKLGTDGSCWAVSGAGSPMSFISHSAQGTMGREQPLKDLKLPCG